jgi:GNAT superfamily N-acetyltransferase
MADRIVFRPLTPERWDDLVDLFGPERGACGGCWCMWPRLRSVEFSRLSKVARRDAFREIVVTGPPPGLIAYEGRLAVGWVAISPRRAVHRFNISRTSAPVDSDASLDTTWALTCFYVRNSHRGRQLTARLATAAIAHARKSGAAAVEVCAIEPAQRLTWGGAFVGVASVLTPLGFVEVARRSSKRPLLRLELGRRVSARSGGRQRRA